MAIIKSSGNGYALYNGAKLPNIETVWTDEIKQTYPYAIVDAQDAGVIDVSFAGSMVAALCIGVNEFEFDSSKRCINNDQPMMVFYYTDDENIADMAPDLGYGVNEWGAGAAATSVNLLISEFVILWSNHNILDSLDSTNYLAATDPIPLDGMNVIEFDGTDTDSDGDSFIRVADYTDISNGVFVTPYEGTSVGTLLKAPHEFSGGAVDWAMFRKEEELFFACGIGEPIDYLESGIYLLNNGVNVTNMYTSLFAYTPRSNTPTNLQKIRPKTFLMGMQTGRLIAGQRMKTSGPVLWETLFEGEVVIGENTLNHGTYWVYILNKTATGKGLFHAGEGIRITVNGESAVFTANNNAVSSVAVAGNEYMWDDEAEDSGYDYMVKANEMGSPIIMDTKVSFYSRNPGTYQAKIERALFEPIAYKYNGVQLPDINTVWTDKETYPYAYVDTDSNMLFVTTTALTNTEERGLLLSGPVTWRSYRYFSLDSIREALGNPDLTAEEAFNEIGFAVDVWTEWEWQSVGASGKYVDWELNWASHDILNTDGTVYLAASEPVPVYE